MNGANAMFINFQAECTYRNHRVFEGSYPAQCYIISKRVTTYSSVNDCFLLCSREPICTRWIQSCIGTAAVTF